MLFVNFQQLGLVESSRFASLRNQLVRCALFCSPYPLTFFLLPCLVYRLLLSSGITLLDRLRIDPLSLLQVR